MEAQTDGEDQERSFNGLNKFPKNYSFFDYFIISKIIYDYSESNDLSMTLFKSCTEETVYKSSIAEPFRTRTIVVYLSHWSLFSFILLVSFYSRLDVLRAKLIVWMVLDFINNFSVVTDHLIVRIVILINTVIASL